MVTADYLMRVGAAFIPALSNVPHDCDPAIA